MDLEILPGKYVVAVSGGVDSMVLLDMLAHTPGLELVVAHFDHGIRTDSAQDRALVGAAAARYNLPYVYEEGNLGRGASEQAARNARYAFLHRARTAQQAQAIIVAHHQDDVLETMILNMLRGTNRKGLSSLQSHGELLRPLLHLTKADMRNYAKTHAIEWHEDSTNTDTRYLRNHLRAYSMPRLTTEQRAALLAINQRAAVDNHEIDLLLGDVLVVLGGPDQLNRQQFIQLPHAVSREVMATWLRAHSVQDITARQIERLVTAAKTAQPGTVHDIDKRTIMNISRKFLQITSRKARNSDI
ncbi:MAG: tRNA lysidine(34) synthetase TilS [Candidatus Saccharibacteria bacterium]